MNRIVQTNDNDNDTLKPNSGESEYTSHNENSSHNSIVSYSSGEFDISRMVGSIHYDDM